MMNFHKLKTLFDPPQVDDENLARTANLLNSSLLWMAGAGIVVVLLYFFFPMGGDAGVIYPVSVGVATTTLILLLKFFVLNRGLVQQTSWALVTIVFIALTISLFLFGGVRDENITWLFLIIAISGLLLGERGVLIFGGLSIVFASALFILETNGVVSDSIDSAVSMYSLVPIVVNLGMSLILIYTAVHQMRINLQQAQYHREALQVSNHELQMEIAERKRTEIALLQANQTILHARDDLEQQVKQRTDELVKANAHLEELLFAITHDLKEPLRSLEFFSERMNQRYTDQIDVQAQDYLMRIHQASRRQRDLLDDIAILAELVQGVQHPKVPTALETAVFTVINHLQHLIDQTNAAIQVETTLPKVYVQPKWVNMAIYNLLENALKYSPQGSRPQIEICSYTGPEGVGLAIKDCGPGISQEAVNKIFKLFHRGVGRENTGTGAGLTITRQIARVHGGECWVSPRNDEGAIFYITFKHGHDTIMYE